MRCGQPGTARCSQCGTLDGQISMGLVHSEGREPANVVRVYLLSFLLSSRGGRRSRKQKLSNGVLLCSECLDALALLMPEALRLALCRVYTRMDGQSW
jgi:hypothetical protein